MAQHDYSIANGTGSAVRSDLNNALAAIVSMNSGSTEPSTTFAFQFWADTNANLLKMRNSANDGWIELRQLDGEFTTVSVANGTAAAPSIFFNASGTDTGIYSNGTDSVDVSTGGTRRLDIGSGGDVTVRGGNVTLNAQGDLRLADSDSSNWVAFQAPATVASNVTWTLPSADGSNGQALTTNGSGTLSWTSAGGASITTGNTTAEVVDTGSDGHFKVTTEGTEALRVDASQQVGIGTASPEFILDTRGSINVSGSIFRRGADNATFSVINKAAQALIFGTDDTERARIDSSGRLLVGLTSQSFGTTIAAQGNSTDTAAEAVLRLKRGSALPTSGQSLGQIYFSDGQDRIGTYIESLADGNFSASSTPGRLVFFTTASGSTSPTERMRITNDGTILFAKTSNVDANSGATVEPTGLLKTTRSAGTPFLVNRTTNDGTLIAFLQDGLTEGTISVSGSTVSYNGAHLSRWSQLASGIERTEILRGSVLSNLDEMCEWGEEENEQLNRMKVSDVEGDKNVAGVFQAWDDDDDIYTNDFYCAMTGDYIIRIAEGVTVERGDLLMSAGDGTAKPQDDDIIRSKTIAKVTSINVSCTYDDGSYCVPCVLMAC